MYHKCYRAPAAGSQPMGPNDRAQTKQRLRLMGLCCVAVDVVAVDHDLWSRFWWKWCSSLQRQHPLCATFALQSAVQTMCVINAVCVPHTAQPGVRGPRRFTVKHSQQRSLAGDSALLQVVGYTLHPETSLTLGARQRLARMVPRMKVSLSLSLRRWASSWSQPRR